VLAAEHLLDFARLHCHVEGVEPLLELGVNGFPCFGKLEQHRQIVGLLAQRRNQVAVLLQASAALLDFLRFGRVFPEIGIERALIEAGQFVVRIGLLKDSSASRRRACRDRRSGASILRL
jgi:hypothetical protein